MKAWGKIEPAITERRLQARSPAQVPVGFRQRGKTRASTELLDLTTWGCKIKLTQTLVIGERVWVTLPSLESWYAKVAWAEDGYAGLEFEQSLHPAVAQLVVTRAAIWTLQAAVP